MVPFVNLKVRQQYQHTRNPAIYPELFIVYRLPVFILIFNLIIYLFYNCIEEASSAQGAGEASRCVTSRLSEH